MIARACGACRLIFHFALAPPLDRAMGISADSVRRITSELVMEGALFSTVDDNHYRTT